MPLDYSGNLTKVSSSSPHRKSVNYAGNKIKKGLEDQGFHPKSVYRLRKSNKPIPLIPATLPRDEKAVFNIRSVKHFNLKVKTQRPWTCIGQCHRCQCFGHIQRNYTLPPRCVKCSHEQQHADCSKRSNVPLNPHPASYRGCNMAPKRLTTSPALNGGSYSDVIRVNVNKKNSTDRKP